MRKILIMKDNKKFLVTFMFLMILSGISLIPLHLSALHCDLTLSSPACGIAEGLLIYFIAGPIFILSILLLIGSYFKRKHTLIPTSKIQRRSIVVVTILVLVNVGWSVFFASYLEPSYLSARVSIQSCNINNVCGTFSFNRPKKGCMYTDFPEKAGQPVRCLINK